jgi:selenium-dependent xanthine dehydrogenase
LFHFLVNGEAVSIPEERKLLDVLRNTLKLTSVKNGCSEGACGTCMILLDGKAVKACVQTVSKIQGKSVITVEGFSSREKEVYSYAFSVCGAVQCGFCTPGMLISAKALLDKNPNPTKDQVKQAINNNICRCTGYKKIEEAILLAAEIFRLGNVVPETDFLAQVGTKTPRIDAEKKTLGTAVYADDLFFDGMVYGSAIRSPVPRCKILSIDLSEVKAIPGIVLAITAEDLPGAKKIGHLRQDWDVLIPVGGETRYLGDAIALICGESKAVIEEAKKVVHVSYEELPPVTSPSESMSPSAPQLHPEGNLLAKEHLHRGNPDEAIEKADYVVTTHYSTPFTEHAFLEPETCVAVPDYEGFPLVLYSGDQGIYQTRKECAAATGLKENEVRVKACMVGGGFGGKEDMSVQHHAAVLARLSGKPVKVSLSRQESIVVHPKRHAMEIDLTTACDKNGYLLAMKAKIISDTGAYASLGSPVLQRACTHAAGPYNYQNIDIVGEAWYTNNPPAGAFRGFGVTQSCFAMEQNLNLLAEKVGISPWEIRYRNAIRVGQELPNGQIADESTALVETLEAVKTWYDEHPDSGIACAMKNSGLGVGIPDVGRCTIKIQNNKAEIYSSAACIGQGLGTVLTQIICQTTGLSFSDVVYQIPDTALAPNAGNTTASRQTLFTGEAARQAGLQLKKALKNASLSDLEGTEFQGEYAGITDKMGSEKSNPVSHIAYGYATHVVTLDSEGRLLKILAAHDVGQAVNPVSLAGQIEGGVVMSLGYALTETYPLEKSVPKAKFGTLGLFRSSQVPPIEPIICSSPKVSDLAFGAKGVGEICSIPTAPAVALAYYLRDGEFRSSLPLCHTPYSKQGKKNE